MCFFFAHFAGKYVRKGNENLRQAIDAQKKARRWVYISIRECNNTSSSAMFRFIYMLLCNFAASLHENSFVLYYTASRSLCVVNTCRCMCCVMIFVLIIVLALIGGLVSDRLELNEVIGDRARVEKRFNIMCCFAYCLMHPIHWIALCILRAMQVPYFLTSLKGKSECNTMRLFANHM